MSVLDEPAAQCRKYEGAFAWVLEDVRPIKPFPVRGELRLFEVPRDVEQLEYLQETGGDAAAEA